MNKDLTWSLTIASNLPVKLYPRVYLKWAMYSDKNSSLEQPCALGFVPKTGGNKTISRWLSLITREIRIHFFAFCQYNKKAD